MLEVVDSPWGRRYLKVEHMCFALERKDLGGREQMQGRMVQVQLVAEVLPQERKGWTLRFSLD
jgi:hypothetical protein